MVGELQGGLRVGVTVIEATIPDDWACVLGAAGDSLSLRFCLAVTVGAICNGERHFFKLTLCSFI